MIALWTNHLSVANRTIDSAHKHILNLTSRADYLIETRDTSALVEAFSILEAGLCAYFEAEENMAKAVNVDFTQHRITHQKLLDDFQCLRNILAKKKDKWLAGEDEPFTIVPWAKRFVQHIKDDGKQLKVVLSTHYYDFRPDIEQ